MKLRYRAIGEPLVMVARVLLTELDNVSTLQKPAVELVTIEILPLTLTPQRKAGFVL